MAYTKRIRGNLTVDSSCTITGDLTISGSLTFPTTATTLTLSGALTCNGTVALGNAKADTITVYGDFDADGTQNPDLDYSNSSGTFKTSTGTNTIGGTVSLAANKNVACAAGTTAIDWSLGTGTFKTTTGAHTIGGDVTIAAGKSISMAAGAGAVDYSSGTGTFKTTTGAHTLAGDVTISGSKTFTTGTGLTTVSGDLQVSGNDIYDSGGAAAITFDGSQNVTCNGNLAVTGTHTFSNASITGDLDIVGTDLQATTGTLNISKSGSATTIKGTLNVDEAATFDTTVGITGAATFAANVTLGNAKADDIKFTGDVIGDGTSNADFDLSASSGTFLTPTGSVTIGPGAVGISGDVTVTANKDVVTSGSGYFQGVNLQCTNFKANDGTAAFSIANSTGVTTIGANKNWAVAAGTTSMDFSGGTGTFLTSSGANTLSGDVTISGTKTFTTGTGNVTIKGDMSIDGGKDFDMSGGAGTFATGTGTVSLAGNTTCTGTLDIQGNTTASAGNPSFDLSGSNSTFATPTGDTTISGDLVLSGHIDGQTLMYNTFQYPAPGTDWTPERVGAGLAANKAAKKFWIPLTGLKVGDEIVSFQIQGDMHEEGGDTCTFDAQMYTVDKADPYTTNNPAGGAAAITQITADGNFDVLETLGSVETVAVDTQYVIECTGTTSNVSGNEKIEVMGLEVVVNRKG